MRVFRFIGVASVVAGLWALAIPGGESRQPLAFNHARHNGLSCVVCHQGVETAARARIPGKAVCEKCHATAPPHVSDAAWRDFTRNPEGRWTQVTHVPDHVAFSHRRHVSIGRLECVSCHADVGRRATPPGRAPISLTMENCLQCHRREGVSEDCAGCHR